VVSEHVSSLTKNVVDSVLNTLKEIIHESNVVPDVGTSLAQPAQQTGSVPESPDEES
ncbi:hypothetical protein A2U01_0072971, partial [Trifolium medium]|nr:hypothetical protein [Trifolium medium]